MPNITWIEFSTALLIFESMKEQLNAIHNLSINTATANMVQSQRNNNRGNGIGSPRGRGNRGRGRNFNSRPICQICDKTCHLASIYYYKTDMAYMGSVPDTNKKHQFTK